MASEPSGKREEVAAASCDADRFAMRDTVFELMVKSNVGAARDTVEVSPESFALLQLLQEKVVTRELLDECLVGDEHLMVAVINQFATVPCLSPAVGPLVEQLKGHEALAALRWDHVTRVLGHDGVPTRMHELSRPYVDNEGRTQLHYANETGDEAVAMAFLTSEYAAWGASHHASDKNTALMAAIVHGNDKLAGAMIHTIGAEACMISATGFEDNTTLQLACRHELPELAMQFLSLGAAVALPGHVNEEGDTALMIACWKGLEDVALKLLHEYGHDACRIDLVNPRGCTALLLAASYKQGRVIQALLERSPKESRPEQASDKGNTPLMLCCMNEMEEACRWLLDLGAQRCALSAVSESGHSALTWACRQGLGTVASHMVAEFGAEVCQAHVATGAGITPLMYCCMRQLGGVALRMLEAGSDACNLRQRDTDGNTARDYAEAEGLHSVVETIDGMIGQGDEDGEGGGSGSEVGAVGVDVVGGSAVGEDGAVGGAVGQDVAGEVEDVAAE